MARVGYFGAASFDDPHGSIDMYDTEVSAAVKYMRGSARKLLV